MAARHCRTNTTHNLCTPRRDVTIMKESRCELINSAKPEKGTPESIRVGSTLSAYLSGSFSFSFFLFSFFFANGTRGNFLIYTVQRLSVYFFRSFSFIMQRIHWRLSAILNSCVSVMLPSRTAFPFLRFSLNFKLHFSCQAAKSAPLFFMPTVKRIVISFAETDSRALFSLN